jgi:hypothetical protein
LGSVAPCGNFHTITNESGNVTLVSGVKVMKPNGLMFAALMFFGARRTS